MLRDIRIINRYEVLENKLNNIMCNTSYSFFPVLCILVAFMKMFQGPPGCLRQRIRLPVKELWVPSLSQEDSLKEEMTTHSSILARRIP